MVTELPNRITKRWTDCDATKDQSRNWSWYHNNQTTI